MPEPKKFALSADEIRPLVSGRGACFASDRITVDGSRVGYCYREEPDNEVDSGWRFLAGDETDAYMEDVANHGVYDVNTIANYDPDIIALLDSPIGSEFARDRASGEFRTLPG
ncbi:MAG: hypothetical protein AMXMBFR33_13520 [Candidatus Xenobia bacterium]